MYPTIESSSHSSWQNLIQSPPVVLITDLFKRIARIACRALKALGTGIVGLIGGAITGFGAGIMAICSPNFESWKINPTIFVTFSTIVGIALGACWGAHEGWKQPESML